MNQTKAKSGYAKVWLNKERIIVCELHGFIDEKVSLDSMDKTRQIANDLYSRSKPVYVVIDGTGVTGQNSAARTSTKMMAGMHIAKLAVIGKGITISLVAQYLMRVSGIKGEARAFRNRRKAERWLLQKRGEYNEYSPLRREGVIGSVIVLGLVSVAIGGWIFRNKTLTELLPDTVVMNPVVAVTFLLLAFIPLLLAINTARYKTLRRWIIGIIVIWTMTFGFLVWIRTAFGSDTRIDAWLFHDQITAATRAAPRTALNLLLVGVMILSILTGQRRAWERYTFFLAASFVLANAVLIITGYAYHIGLIEFTGFVPMPLSTALVFLVLVSALWPFSRPLSAFTRLRIFFSKYQFVFFVLAGGLVFTGYMWQQSKIGARTDESNRAIQAFDKQENILSDRIDSYITVLYGFRSLFEGSMSVSADEFTVYFTSSHIQQRYPGLNGIAYVQQVPDAQKQTFQALIRQQSSALNPQLKNFTIHPPDSPQPLSYVITYIEPDKNVVKQASGFDLSTDAERLQTMSAARDSGSLATTGTINIDAAVSGATKEKPGFFITSPIYSDEIKFGEPKTVEDRRNRLSGFINASFVYQELFEDIFKDEKRTDLQFVVSDIATGTTIYTYNPNAKNIEKQVKHENHINVGGRAWRLSMYTSASFGITAQGRVLPFAVLGGGVALTILAAMLVLSQVRRREAAVALAASMTEDFNNERNAAVASKERDDAILSSIADGVFVIDSDERIILFNPATESISGYNADEAIGNRYKDILRFEDARTGKVKDDFIKQALDGKVARLRNHAILTRKDGRQIAVANSAAPLVDYRHKTIGAIVVFRDVTREAELSRAKDEFVSLASHQLRTPLSAVNWYAEMLLDGDVGPLSKKQKEHVQEIHEGNQRMITLVNSLLDVSRIDLGKFINEPVDTSVAKLTDSLEKEMSEIIAVKRMKIEKDIPKNLPAVFIDPKLLRAIIQNMLSNAVKYTPAKGLVKVSAWVARQADCTSTRICTPGKYILIEVSDTGYGIPAAQQNRVFEKLFRADNVRSLELEGTGLGLYYIKQIIDKLGGGISFKSTESVGTTFTVILPLRTKRATIERDTMTK